MREYYLFFLKSAILSGWTSALFEDIRMILFGGRVLDWLIIGVSLTSLGGWESSKVPL